MGRIDQEAAKWAGETHPYVDPELDTEGSGDFCCHHLDNKYLLGRLLGWGGSSQVYEALQLERRRGVAIKVLHPALSDDDEVAASFHREAQIASRLEHRNIVQIFDCCTDEVVGPYIVMELFDGPSLKDVISFETELDLDNAISRLRQTLDALACAHAAGVIHADLKPANIMVEATDDGDEELKLLDFGVAVSNEGIPLLSATLSGTPNYVSPEVIEGARPRAAADIYAAGVIFYELLTGELPFWAPTIEDLLAKHLRESPPSVGDCPRVRELGAAVVDKLDSIIARAMAKDPNQRFASTDEFHRALDGLSPRAIEADRDQKLEQALGLLERIEDLDGDETALTESCDLWLELGHVRRSMGESHHALVAAFRALHLSIRSGAPQRQARCDALIAQLRTRSPISAAGLHQFPVRIAPRRTLRARTPSIATSARASE